MVQASQIADILTRHQDDDICHSTQRLHFHSLCPHAVQKGKPWPSWITNMRIDKSIAATSDTSCTSLYIKTSTVLGTIVTTLVASNSTVNAGPIDLCYLRL